MDHRRIAHYEITDRIGAGGMGEVYRARDTRLGRDVALKFLPEAFAADADRLARFEREARLLASLNHPNIAAIYGLEREGDRQVLVLELVEGEELSERIARGPIPLNDARRVADQVAAALEAAHEQGVIHRDLKPANIKVTPSGTVKVLDFGLAKALDADSSQPELTHSPTVLRSSPTMQGVILGTASYMAPEQARGKLVDRRADVWAFGCVVYEMLAGRMAFQGETVTDILARILEREPDWGALPASVTPALRYVLEKCLAKDAGERWRSADDVAMMMRRTAQSRGMSDGVVEPERARGGGWRLRALTAVLAVALAWSLITRGSRHDTVKDAQHAGAAAPAMLFERLTVQGGEEQYPKISPDGTFIVYQAEDGSDADIFFQRVAGGRAINLTESSPEDDWAPAISPDGQRIAFNSDRGDGGLFVMGATGESVRRVADALNNPCWAPDGKRVVASTAGFGSPLARGVKGDLWFVDVDSGEKQQLTHDTDAVQPDWSPHGHRVAYWGIQDITGGQRDLWTVGVESGDIVPVTADSPVDWCPVWAPDGGHLYFLSDRAGSFNVWRVAVDERSGAVTGTPEPVAAPAENVGAFDISGDGTRIVYPARAARANIFRADFDPEGRVAARESQVTRGTLIITDFNVSPDGEWFVYRGGTSREDLYLSRSDGTETRKLTDDRYRDRGPKWAPDGNKVYFYSDRSGRYEYWSIRPDGSDLQQISKTEGNSWWYPNPSPDGGRLLGHNETGTSILDIARVPVGMAEATLLPNVDDNTIPRMTAWSPDGSHLAGCAIDRHEEDVPGLLVYSFESDSYRRLATSLTDINQSVYWLGDGRRVMAISGGKLVRVDTENGEVRELLDVGFGTFGLCVRADAKAYFIRFETEADIWMATQE